MSRLSKAIHVQERLTTLVVINFILIAVFLGALIIVGISALSKFSQAQDQIIDNQALIQAQTCLIAKSTIVEIEATRALFDAFAKHFGVHVKFPDLPAPPHSVGCKPAGGDDVFIGTNDPNKLRGTGSNDFMAGNGGNDKIVARPGNDTVFGGTGNDILWGNPGADILNGDDGNDTINARYRDKGQGKDTVNGGAGFDTCYVNAKDNWTSCEKVVKV